MSTVLTREIWIERCTHWMSGPSLEFWENIYEEFIEFPIMFRFLSYPNVVQPSILLGFIRGKTVKNTANYLDLCNRVDSKLHELTGKENIPNYCIQVSFTESSSEIDSVIGKPSKIFDDSLHQVFVLVRESNKYQSTWSPYVRETMYFLYALYGETTILEIMQMWIETKGFVDQWEIILLAENWSTVRKYPLQWAITMLSN